MAHTNWILGEILACSSIIVDVIFIPLITPIVVPYIIPYITSFKEFRP